MTLKNSFVTIRYYTAADPYHYTIDNRPMTDLKTCLDFLADTLDGGFSTSALSATQLGLSSAQGVAADVLLNRDAAQILAQRNGVNAQALRVYNTFTDASNYERATINWTDSANVFTIGTSNAGTGTARPMEFRTAGTNWWQLATTGHILAKTDNTNDIGASGATRPRSLYLASRYVDGRQVVTYSTSMTIDASTGNNFSITATDGVGFTINAPTNPVTGQKIYITIRNTSGGALGTATWNAAFKMATWTQPANTNSRTIKFIYDGTNWVEFGRTTTDIPN